jgi:hypothetical protein
VKTIIIIILLTASRLATGQIFEKKFFAKTDWYTNNDADIFYKSDTIVLFQHNICNYPIDIKTYCESETRQFKHGNIIQVSFGKRNKMTLTARHGNGYQIRIDQKWQLDKNNNLVLKPDEKNIYTFKPISSRQVNVPSDYATEVTTTELTLTRVKSTDIIETNALKLLIDSIAKYTRLDGFYFGYPNTASNRYSELNRLTEIASSQELLELIANKNTTIKAAAFQSLCAKDSVDIIPIVMSHLYDTSLIAIQQGCIGSQQMTGDYFLQVFNFYLATKDSNYWVNNYSRIAGVDSILFYDPKIRLEYKESKIRGINGDTSYYDRIREIALKERIPVSVLALAKYKRQKDKAIIESYFADEKTQYYAIWAVREFHDTSFYPLLIKVFEKEWKDKHYDYIKWRILYQALAQYPNATTLELFDKTISAKDKFRYQTLGRYLTIAITKYPNPLFDRYQNKVQIDNFHKEFMAEEANAEN